MLQIRPRLYECDPQALQVDMHPLLDRAGVEFQRGEAVTLDPGARTVAFDGGDKSAYGRLVVATGSVMRRPPIAGAERAFSVDTVAEAVAFDERLAQVVRGRDVPALTVVGAGFTGIELALELRDRIARHGTQRQAEIAHIVLVDRADAVGVELGPGPRPLIEAALNAARVELRLGVTPTEIDDHGIVLAGSERIDADAVVLTTGMVAAPFACKVPGDHDPLGRVVVDQYLRAPKAPGVFVAGDAAAADGGDGHLVVQSCQHALQLGRFAGENAARDLTGRPLIPYVQPPYITCLDLGSSGAVFTRGWDRDVAFAGEKAKAAKRRINTQDIYPPRDGTREELLMLSNLDPRLPRR